MTFQVFIGVLAALTVREIYIEVYDYIGNLMRSRRLRKVLEDVSIFRDHLEDIVADDED